MPNITALERAESCEIDDKTEMDQIKVEYSLAKKCKLESLEVKQTEKAKSASGTISSAMPIVGEFHLYNYQGTLRDVKLEGVPERQVPKPVLWGDMNVEMLIKELRLRSVVDVKVDRNVQTSKTSNKTEQMITIGLCVFFKTALLLEVHEIDFIFVHYTLNTANFYNSRALKCKAPTKISNQQDGRLAPAYFSPNYKYFDQFLQTVKNKTTVLILDFKEFLQTSIPPLISVLYAKGYHDFPLKNFRLTTEKLRRGTLLCFIKFLVSKKFMDKRGREGVSRFSVENFLSHSAENFRRGTP